MRVIVRERYRAEISAATIDSILGLLGLDGGYTVEYAGGDGRNIVIETDGDKRIYVIISRENADARNAFLAQYIPTVLKKYVDDPTLNKEICVYLSDVSARAKTDFIVDTYRTAKTLGISILNEDALGMDPIGPYRSFTDWKRAKTARQENKPNNNSSYAIEEDEGYIVYGKLYGANGKEAVFTACLLAQIAKTEGKRVSFVQVKEHGVETLSDTDLSLLGYFGVEIEGGEIVLDRKNADRSTCRKQDEFRYNLLEKYGGKKCYLCDCDVDRMIIASHIHRITDIDGSDLTPEEKRRQAVDGDNGFWLCANHDKMFEYGIITFDTEGNIVVNDELTERQREYVKSLTPITRIRKEHLTEGLKKYMALHNARVRLGDREP